MYQLEKEKNNNNKELARSIDFQSNNHAEMQICTAYWHTHREEWKEKWFICPFQTEELTDAEEEKDSNTGKGNPFQG